MKQEIDVTAYLMKQAAEGLRKAIEADKARKAPYMVQKKSSTMYIVNRKVK